LSAKDSEIELGSLDVDVVRAGKDEAEITAIE
jgi:hypothetical protein